jgi:formate-dependent nitrite reductase membrane component NrfD
MSNSTSQMVGDSFRVGYRFQRHWDTSMANAFFCGELGGGTFFVSMLHGFVPGMVLGLLLTGCGKTYFHLSHMGVPAKSWRAILRPDRSWISRGLIAIVLFVGAGAIHAIDVAFGHALPALLGTLVQLVAALAALVVCTYQGFAMSHSSAIALWSSAIMPVSSLLYAMTAGTMLTLLLGGLSMGNADLARLHDAALLLLLADAVMLLSLLHAAHNGSPGAKLSVELLLKTVYARRFYLFVVAAGVVAPALLLWLAGGAFISVLLACIGVLTGFYAYRVLMFKAGVYEPILSFKPQFGLQ